MRSPSFPIRPNDMIFNKDGSGWAFEFIGPGTVSSSEAAALSPPVTDVSFSIHSILSSFIDSLFDHD